jgi:hypothetical protein
MAEREFFHDSVSMGVYFFEYMKKFSNKRSNYTIISELKLWCADEILLLCELTCK